ncbi:ComF family protein [Verminephrobacter eiseniae]|uniref:phosphoribosyltransferase family protein n=1 Tax=Verminephrobacter eiseniae TaxID=364317 RepID=UPI002236F61C|nr:phosphoribosyltransferase family protein [Verminephrobacter eiseniae]MCW5262148.1 ComF family protein [Verminephrobacter eiseniae]
MLFTGLPGLSRRLRAWAAGVPSQCAVCHAWPAQRVCAACVARFAAPAIRCQRCALRVPSGVLVCGACLHDPPVFDACLAALDYAYPWADALADFKFRADPGWAGTLSTLLRATPGVASAIAAADRVLPVPLSAQRLRERGFNQSALLAQPLAGAKTDVRTLLRRHATEAQSGLPRAQRLRNLRGAFALAPPLAAALRGQRLVLLDDVMTTSATVHAATLALREAGAAHVTVVVLARTAASTAASQRVGNAPGSPDGKRSRSPCVAARNSA